MSCQSKYKELLDYYFEIISSFDIIHFNSSISKENFIRNGVDNKSEIIPICNSCIKDNRTIREYNNKKLRMIFIGNFMPYKGLPMLLNVLSELNNDGIKEWNLNIWGCKKNNNSDKILWNGFYKSSDLKNIYNEDSVLIVPSIWKETFSLIVLEALSFGIPVLVSNNVGAKDIIKEYDKWFIFNNKQELELKLKELIFDRKRLILFNKSIVEKEWKFSMEKHNKQILELYKTIINSK